MAKKKLKRGRAGTVSAYFREKFQQRPDLVDERSNEELFNMWLADNPGHEKVPLNVRQGLSNIKSSLRGKKSKKGGRRGSSKAVASNGVAPKTTRISAAVLERLELQIDECMMLARGIDPDALGEVIRDLRKARQVVVWKQGA